MASGFFLHLYFFLGSKSPLLVVDKSDLPASKPETAQSAVSFDPSARDVDREASPFDNDDVDMATYEAQLEEATRALLTADECNDIILIKNAF